MQNRRNKTVKTIFSIELAFVRILNQQIIVGFRNRNFQFNHEELKNNLVQIRQTFYFLPVVLQITISLINKN